MSWTQELYKVYEDHFGEEQEGETSELLPISHSTANAQIEVTIDETGTLQSARRIDRKEEARTIIPVTENSGTRSSGIAPHPLADKLVYLAGDYGKFVKGKRTDNEKFHEAYMEQLRRWRDSSWNHPAVTAIEHYLSRGTLMEDLVESRVLLTDESDGHLKGKEKIQGIAQEDAMVRFRVNYRDLFRENRTWEDTTLYDSFIGYNGETMEQRQICYATGENLPVTYKHPSKIRNAGDKAKLISSNDESGFTYRGRFASKEEALSVSYDFSQKVHNALKWLIERQGVSVGSLTLVVWESSLAPLPNVLGNPEWDDEDDEDEEMEWENEMAALPRDTVSAYRDRLRKVLWGEKSRFDVKSKAIVMGLDSATTGRLSMPLYEEMATSAFLHHVEEWHRGISWYRYNPQKKREGIHSFSLYDLADCAFGTEQGGVIKCRDEVRKDTVYRLIPCVIEGRRLPVDIVRNAVIRASKPTAYEKSYNWRKVLTCACGLIKESILEDCHRERAEEEYIMQEKWKEASRDCLYGRLLAIADAAESSTYERGSERETNARRYFEAFSNHPYQSWGTLHQRLMPYFNRMPEGGRIYYTNLIQNVMTQFDPEEYRNNSKLKPEFLLAYYCQLDEIYHKNQEKEEQD